MHFPLVVRQVSRISRGCSIRNFVQRMIYSEDHIRNKLIEALNASHVEVVDESDGCGGKFSVLVVSDIFQGKPLLQRHRLVNGALEEELKTIHAFSQQTLTVQHFEMALDNLVSLKISAPAKIILHGEHSVVYGKTAVAASLNLRTYVALHEENLVDSIRFMSKSVDVDVNFTKESIEALMGTVLDCSWFDPLKINHEKLLDQIGVFLESLNLNFNRNQKNSLLAFLYLFVGMTSSRAFPIEAFTIEISSDLTLNSGSGSSASYVVALAATFLQYLRVKNQERYLSDLTAISSNVSKFDITKFLDDEKKIIADWAWLAERIIHGSSSGLDPSICTMGSLIKFRKNETGKHIETLNISNGLRIFLVDTGIPRDIKVLVGKVKSLLQDQPVFVQETFDQMDALALEACDLISSIDSNKFNVFPSEASLQLYQKLSDVIRKNQDCLSDLGVSHRSLNKICEISASYLLPAKLTGAGGGGFAYVLLSPNSNGQDENKLIKELNDAGFKVSNVTICGPGVTID